MENVRGTVPQSYNLARHELGLMNSGVWWPEFFPLAVMHAGNEMTQNSEN